MLEANNVTFRVGSSTLLCDLSAAFSPGKLHLVVGPNGAGKSTLIKVLAGLLTPTAGSVDYDGVNLRNINRADLAKCRAVLSQAAEIAFPLTVHEVVVLGRSPHFGTRPSLADERIAREVMELFEVAAFSDRNYMTLSGGERQRVNFARVLTQIWPDQSESGTGPSFRYLFLDEPLTFLDIRHQLEFMKKVVEFARNSDVVTVAVVHDLNLAGRFADSILVLDGGRVAASGTPNEVLTSDIVRNVFGVESHIADHRGDEIHLIFE